MLNHEITQALACSARLEKNSFSKLLAGFGILHFFVVSGAHLNIILVFFNQLKVTKHKQWLKHLILFIFVSMCNYSPPILRVFLYQLIKKNSKDFFLFSPSLVNHFISYTICLFLFWNSNFLIFSASLSFTFSFFLFFARGEKEGFLIYRFYFLTLPFFLFVFGVPHISTLIITPVTAVILGTLLLPASLISLFYSRAESLAIEIWWLFQDFIKFTAVFFNFPKKDLLNTEFISSEKLIVFNFLTFLLTSIGVVIWRRKSYSFS